MTLWYVAPRGVNFMETESSQGVARSQGRGAGESLAPGTEFRLGKMTAPGRRTARTETKPLATAERALKND